MQRLIDWATMGGYGAYVWSAYTVVLVIFVLNAIGCNRQKKRIEKSLKNWFKQTAR